MVKNKKPTITISFQQQIVKTEKKLTSGFFECLQPFELRSRYCTGKGFGIGKAQNICAPCLTELKKSLSYSSG
jgi:hypothetical protein